MKIIHPRCAALVVSKNRIDSYALTEAGEESGRFRTDTASVRQLGRWLIDREVVSVAVDASGTYWKPIWGLLESEFGNFSLVLASLESLRELPGRSADESDAAWLARLHRYGLIRGGRIPDRDKRELQDLMKARHQLILDRQRMVSRIRRLLHAAGIRLRGLVIDVTGKAGLSVLRALVSGERSPEKLVELIESGLRGKPDEILTALDHSLDAHQRLLVEIDLQVLESLTRAVERLDKEIERRMKPSQKLVERLQEIPGIALRSAQEILAYTDTETSLDLSSAPPASATTRARKGIRCDLETQAFVDGRPTPVRLVDLSLGGAKLRTGPGLQRGRSLQLRNPTQGHAELVEARIVWVRAHREEEGQFDVGLRFEDSPEALGRSWVVGLLHRLRSPQVGKLASTPSQLPVELLLASRERVEGTATSLGLGGAAVSSTRTLNPRSTCALILGPVGNLEKLEIRAEVVSSRPLAEGLWNYEMSFPGISSTQTRLLGRYLIDQVKNGQASSGKT